MTRHIRREENLRIWREINLSTELLLSVGVISVVLAALSGKYLDQVYRASLTNLHLDVTTKKISTVLEIATTGRIPDDFPETGTKGSQVVVIPAQEEPEALSERQENLFERMLPNVLVRSYSTLQKERSIDALSAANFIITDVDSKSSGETNTSRRTQNNIALRQTSLTGIQLVGNMSVEGMFVINGSLYYVINSDGNKDLGQQNIMGYTLASTKTSKPQTVWYTCSGVDYGQRNYGPVIVSGRFQEIETGCQPGKYSR